MARISRRTVLMEYQKKELAEKVIKIVGENKEGLTSAQLGIKIGGGLPRGFLTRLQKENKIEQKKKMLPDGTIATVYVLARKSKNH